MEKVVVPDNYINEDMDDYCVKLGKTIPGGCNEEYCGDINQCPYIKKSDVIEDL